LLDDLSARLADADIDSLREIVGTLRSNRDG
jgi:hypothetical protein